MKRKIINIDDEKCTGCGLCIPDCPEGALQILDGKARLVSDLFCDGLGACMGTCPEGAITVIEREAGAYDEKAVMATISQLGEVVIVAHLEHLIVHGETDLYNQAIEYLNEHGISIRDHQTVAGHDTPEKQNHHPFAGCPGAAAQRIARDPQSDTQPSTVPQTSELRQWPVQLQLLNPANPYFDGADLLIAADCVPFAYAGFHQDFLTGKILIIFCPKLDADIEGYIVKLADIISLHTITSITVLHMEVPCCSGVTHVLNKALERSGKSIPVTEHTITLQGQVIPADETR
ncbi:MAG TPA: 4Fe-4S binding protein [Methanospirillum sp.]|nr:4Fe-4S binding protein [Methanospirillum sp.]